MEWFVKRQPVCWPRLIADGQVSPFNINPDLLCSMAAPANGQNPSPLSPLRLLLTGSTPPSYRRVESFIGLRTFDPFRVLVYSLDLSGGSFATIRLGMFVVSGVSRMEAIHPLHHIASCMLNFHIQRFTLTRSARFRLFSPSRLPFLRPVPMGMVHCQIIGKVRCRKKILPPSIYKLTLRTSVHEALRLS